MISTEARKQGKSGEGINIARDADNAGDSPVNLHNQQGQGQGQCQKKSKSDGVAHQT